MRAILLLLTILVGSYALLCCLASLFQKRLVFFPSRTMSARPGDVGLAFEDVWLQTTDAIRLHAWFVPCRSQARGVVLFLHGNAGNIADRLATLAFLNQLGFATLALDYRGYGRSEGSINEQGSYLDAQAAWDHLVEERGYDPERIVLLGRSLGAAVAIELAGRTQPGALIAESAFTSVRDIARKVYPWLPTRLILRIRYDSAARVALPGTPKLFVHSLEDEIIPSEMGRRLFALAEEPKAFLEIRGSHNGGWLESAPVYRKGLETFLDSAGFPSKTSP